MAHTGLQFGHGVGAVENKTTEATADSSTRKLQFGHGVGAVENVYFVLVMRPKRTPLQFGHGVGAVENDLFGVASAAEREASIRPRRWSRGEHGTALQYFRGSSLLQFGHGVGAVENGCEDGLRARTC